MTDVARGRAAVSLTSRVARLAPHDAHWVLSAVRCRRTPTTATRPTFRGAAVPEPRPNGAHAGPCHPSPWGGGEQGKCNQSDVTAAFRASRHTPSNVDAHTPVTRRHWIPRPDSPRRTAIMTLARAGCHGRFTIKYAYGPGEIFASSSISAGGVYPQEGCRAAPAWSAPWDQGLQGTSSTGCSEQCD